MLKLNLFLWWKSWIFSIISPVFSVTWSFRNIILICGFVAQETFVNLNICKLYNFIVILELKTVVLLKIFVESVIRKISRVFNEQKVKKKKKKKYIYIYIYTVYMCVCVCIHYTVYLKIQYILCNIFAHAVNRVCKVLKLITRIRGRWQVECFYKIIKRSCLSHKGTCEMLSDGDNESMVLEYTGLHEYLMQPSGHFVNRLCCQSKLIKLV